MANAQIGTVGPKKGLGKESQAVRNQTKGAPTADDLRANHLSTGGGEPIEKGHKWTSEHRVLQPRDPSTGHFEYNSSANFSLKYKSRGKGVPLFMRGWKIDYVKKGDVLLGSNGKRYFAPINMSKEEFIDNMKYYIEGKDGVGHYMGLDSGTLKTKTGALSKAEQFAAGNPATQGEIQVVGHKNLGTLSYSSRKKLNEAAAKYKEAVAHKPPLMGSPAYAQPTSISQSKLTANQQYNANANKPSVGTPQAPASQTPKAQPKVVNYFGSDGKFSDEGRKNVRNGYESDPKVKATVDSLSNQFGATSDEIMSLIENGSI